MRNRSKWLVKKMTENGLVVLSEHLTEKDARWFWRGYSEGALIFQEKTQD